MTGITPDALEGFVRASGPEPTAVQREMEAYAREHGFPIVGREVGGLLRLFARMVDAAFVFECGSGFGYSASWFAHALPDDGRVVLTEHDPDELDMAREFFDRDGIADRATFEEGDALDVVTRYDGPFDVVLLDHEKRRYVEGFQIVREKVAPGGILIADNMMHGPIDFDDVLAGIQGEAVDTDESSRGVISYIDRVRADPEFDTAVLPVGSGIAVSCKHPSGSSGP